MIPRSMDGKTRVLSLSYGKDSMACLGALELLGWPLDRIVTADIWATEDIPADLPPMVEFKDYADKVILERYGLKVEHFYANKFWALEKEKVTYRDGFLRQKKSSKYGDEPGIYGWPTVHGPWCQQLKLSAIQRMDQKDAIQYIGIAADEPNRFHSLGGNKVSPLVEAGWTEADCREWCEQNGLLSPIYTKSARGGCWFCHNQGVQQLRNLRHDYPELWAILLQWDSESPVTFKADGWTVHDYDKRFQLEDDGLLSPDDKRFRWSMLNDELNYRWF